MSIDPSPSPAVRDPEDRTRTFLLSGAAPGVEIGPYKLLRLLGEGGMGLVYHAQQFHPIRRDVALKIIKPGMDSKQVIARFESERQTLAIMDHANIAHVFDAGTTAVGLPYFVMELVEGIPINEYCDSKRLPVRQRIELFIPVCQAVQHAHQKGIIHRDLKPTNILVGEREGKAAPKVIDFGLAKALSQHLANTTMTRVGAVVGTLDYMSPEQADPARRDVDTRSDVYSLGAVLYELLTGVPPLDCERITELGLVEVLRRIRDEENPPPSARLRRSAATAEIAAQRQSDGARLPKLLHGELDWMCMKALEKDRTRRYQTVNGLARDLERYLANEPVEAAPPSAAYRMRKLVRKHVLGFSFAATVLTMLLGFAVAVTVQARRIGHERDRANQEAEIARQVSSFLTQLFSLSNPSVSRGNAVTARELLDQGATKIGNELKGQPGVRASLLDSMASAYDGLGLFPQADKLAAEGLDLRRRVFGRRSLEAASSLHTMASVAYNQDNFAAAIDYDRQALDIDRALLPRGDIRVVDTMHSLGDSMGANGEFQQAIPLLREALELARQQEGPDGETTADATQRLGANLWKARDYAAAEPLLREAIRIYERREGENSVNLAGTLNDLANLLSMKEDLAGADAAYRRARDTAARIFGPDHPNVAILDQNLAANLWRQHRYAEAEALTRDSMARFVKALGDRHPRYSVFLDGLGDILRDKGDMAGAGALYRQALDFDEARAKGHFPTSYTRMGDWLARTGHPEQGEPMLRKGIEELARSTPAGSPEMAEYQRQLGQCLVALRRLPEAESVLQQSYETFRKALGETHRQTRESGAALAAVYDAEGKHTEAEKLKGAS